MNKIITGLVVLICENKMTRVGLEPTTSTYRGSNILKINGGFCDNENDLNRYLEVVGSSPTRVIFNKTNYLKFMFKNPTSSRMRLNTKMTLHECCNSFENPLSCIAK